MSLITRGWGGDHFLSLGDIDQIREITGTHLKNIQY